MKIHEYQAKALFQRFGIPVPRGRLCRAVEEAGQAHHELGDSVSVVKAQIHAGGRGKAGGVRIARSRAQAEEHARALLGSVLRTNQTGPEGRRVTKLLVEEGLPIEREFYAAIAVDRRRAAPVLLASAEGGVEIESVPRERLLQETLDAHEGLRPFQARAVAFGLGLRGLPASEAAKLLEGLARLFLDLDASLAEVNPFVLLRDGRVLALDAKVSFDENALFRHADLLDLRDPEEEDPAEARAAAHNLSYVKLDGTIGCMVNGAGLAMATMDIIRHHGGAPANFLDVGGGASVERVTEAFRIICEDPNVRTILVNIFGGIVKCDLIAEGILGAVKSVGLKVPLVVRLEGTNVERGRALLRESGLAIQTAADMTDAARKAVEAAR
jgi:succinyl-CoA synthetase beta subunit